MRSLPRAPVVALLLLTTILVVLGMAAADEGDEGKKAKAAAQPHVVITTSQGAFEVELLADAAPETVRTFLGLALGEGEFHDVRTKKAVTIEKPFYDGLGFHRIIAGFMIQGGCPAGNGTGNPGFMFGDEMDADALGLAKEKLIDNGRVHPWVAGLGQQNWQQKVLLPMIRKLQIDPAQLNQSPDLQAKLKGALETMSLKDLYELQGYKYTQGLPSRKPQRGDLALANAGPATNGSQFFVNVRNTPELTGKHTVFGRVVKGMDIVDKIAGVKVNAAAGNRPVEPVTIISIRRAP
ncbi:MAG: peptidylprolyl isomerase [Planctomycetota bacterium]|nr:peptidylprolyl isomerase [Planctomycetota bacterium]